MDVDKIYLGDCMELMDSIPDGSIDLVVSDPPYLFDNGYWLKSATCGSKGILGQSGSIYSADGKLWNMMSNFGVDDIYRLMEKMVTKLKKVQMYLCCNETQVPIYGMWAREHGYHFGILTWEKPLSIINHNRFSTNAEYVVRIYEDGMGLNHVADNEWYNKVIHTKPCQGKDKIHPTQKPVALFQRLIELSSKEGALVLDPFMGSGTTAAACYKSGRHYIGFEKDDEYFGKAVERMKYIDADLFS